MPTSGWYDDDGFVCVYWLSGFYVSACVDSPCSKFSKIYTGVILVEILICRWLWRIKQNKYKQMIANMEAFSCKLKCTNLTLEVLRTRHKNSLYFLQVLQHLRVFTDLKLQRNKIPLTSLRCTNSSRILAFLGISIPQAQACQ